MTDHELMGLALDEARKAAALGEVPVGAVVARRGEVVSAAHNTRETEKNALHHAELLAIDAACKKLGGWRLWECELFVTLEPCPMCAGAIANARLCKLYFGAYEKKSGSAESRHSLLTESGLNWSVPHEGGLLEEECAAALKNYFKIKREERKKN